MLQLTYELRPKWNKNNKNKNAVSRSDPLQGSDNHDDIFVVVDDDGGKVIPFCCFNHSLSDSQEEALSTG